MQACGVVPVVPAEGGELDVLDVLQGSGAGGPANQLGLVVAVDGLGQGVEAPMSSRAGESALSAQHGADDGDSLATAVGGDRPLGTLCSQWTVGGRLPARSFSERLRAHRQPARTRGGTTGLQQAPRFWEGLDLKLVHAAAPRCT